MFRLSIHLVLIAALGLASCAGDDARPGSATDPASPGEAGEPAVDESPPGAGVEAPGEVACVNGWVDPDDREQRELPFHVIRRTQKVDGDFDVVEMRYFEGPEGPPTDKGYLATVDRWYVKAVNEGDPTFRGRWLVEERPFGSGLAAAAPFDSTGFSSPDWVGFQYEVGVDERLRPYPELELPGRWAGRPYDFVTGKDLETGQQVFHFAGLPAEVAGCLEGT